MNTMGKYIFIILLVLASGCVQKPYEEPVVEKSIERSLPEPGEKIPGGAVGKAEGEVKVDFVDSSYKVATGRITGWFSTGQAADIMLSGLGFNNTGGPLMFNHPGGISTDGRRLLLADRNNNRILIWNSLPDGNTKPDIVLGQKDFTSNNPGEGLDQLNWPVAVATDGEHVLVADTGNDRILIWNSFPTQNGQKADVVLQGSEALGIDTRGNILWPWAVWSDGEKVVVASTGSGQVLIWNRFPTKDNQPPDVISKLEEFGTPRSIASDGRRLVVGDHNAFGMNQGTFFWKTFPKGDDQKFDFVLKDPERISGEQAPQEGTRPGQVLWGDFTRDGKFIAFGIQIYIWNQFPEDEYDTPDFIIGARSPHETGYRYDGGDGSGLAIAGSRLYLTLSNGNKVIGFDSIPTRRDQEPDFVVGSPDIYTNTMETNFFITNPVPITDGEHLFALSDYDKKLYVWRNLPDESGAKPDLVYTLPEPVWDGAIKGETLVLAGGSRIYLWRKLPLTGEKPEVYHSFGNAQFRGLGGVAIGDKYFYLSDLAARRIYIWEGVPDDTSNPKFVLENEHPGRLSSDGEYLVVTDTVNHRVLVYEVNNLDESPEPLVVAYPAGRSSGVRFNLPLDAIVFQGSLFVADTGFNRVVAWRSIKDATSGKAADVILGENGLEDTKPEIGRDKLFWPAGLAFDGSYLWVGEFKFSNRILRFSPTTEVIVTPQPSRSWIKESGVRVKGGVPYITARPEGGYRLYYCKPEGIFSAVSDDGLTFIEEAGVRVSGGCDPSIVPLDGGGYRMYYKLEVDPNTHVIHSAVSQDGLTWDKEGLRFQNMGSPCHGWTSVPDAVRLPDGRVRIYFVCDKTLNAVASIISGDGLNFALEEGFRLERAVDPNVLRLPDNTYRMFYATAPEGKPVVPPDRIYTARSSDGLAWTVEGEVLSAGGPYEHDMVVDPSAIALPSGKYRVYYGGGGQVILSAVSAFTIK